jgi:hypothetical protein
VSPQDDTVPERPPQVDAAAWAVVMQVTGRLLAEGAHAVVLTGSHARGTALPESDIDLHPLGEGPGYLLERSGPFLVSISWRTPDVVRADFRAPLEAPGVVPAWRQAVIVADPRGEVAVLQAEAHAWSWAMIGNAAIDAAVAEGFYGYAEEVHKLVTNLQRGRLRVAAVQRSVLALRMARIAALHLRLLYDSEDVLWDLVSARMGPEWERTQAAALGERGEHLLDSCHAALDLFRLTHAIIAHLLDARQTEVVQHAVALAERSRQT